MKNQTTASPQSSLISHAWKPTRRFSTLFLFALAVILTALAGSQRAAAVGELELFYTDRMVLAWNDGGSGGSYNGSFWVPDVPAGYKPLGHIAVSGYGQPAGMTVVKLAGAGSALAYPVDFVAFWYDGGSGASMSTQFWKPIPPAGYVSLGTVCSINTYAKPALDSVVCVRSDLVVAASIGGSHWNDSGSGGDQDGSSWDIVAPAGAIDINAFQGQRSHSPPSETVYCLKASAAAPPSAPSDAQVASMINGYGPVFKFHPDEPWMPDDPAVILNDPGTRLKWMTVQNESSNPGFAQTDLGSSTTSSGTIARDIQQALSHPMANDPSFKYLLDYPFALAGGNLSRTKAWVRVQPHISGHPGRPHQNTELQFWIFYPYNGPGKSRMTVGDIYTEYYDPTGTYGIHYSDWECVRVRLTNKNVWDLGTYKFSSAVLSRHDTDEEIFAGDPRLTDYLGSPIVYVGKGSHAHYPTAGVNYYKRLASADFGVGTFAVDLYDLTGNGQSLNAYDSSKYVIVSSAWPGITTATPDWLFFGGTWGKYLLNDFSATIDYGVGTHTKTLREVGNGKPGLLRRPEWGVNAPQNANLELLRTSTGTISPAFNPNVTAYTMNAGAGVSQLTLLAQAGDDTALVEVKVNAGAYAALAAGQLLGKQSNPLPLTGGSNTVSIRVTVPPPSAPIAGVTPTVKTYTITVIAPVPIPVINSPLTASGNQGTPFNYQISATNTPTSYNATGLPAGVTVNTANGLISGTPTVSGSFSVSLTATNAGGPGTATLGLTIAPLVTYGTALDTTGLSWAPGGNANWYGQAVTTHDGVDAAQSGDIGDGQESWLETTVTGPGTLGFWWRVSSEQNYDYLLFTLNGVQQAAALEISGEMGWEQKTVSVPAGSHTLRWNYFKDGSESSGADAGWVDQVVFTPTQPEIAIDLPSGSIAVGGVVAWGDNENGQTTVPVAAQSGVTGIAAGYVHTAALKTDGTVVAWGNNSFGETAVPVDLNGVVAIAGTRFHTAALKSNGTVRTWGYGTETTVPPGLNDVRAIAAGFAFTVALKNDGSVVAWGNNSHGQATVPAAALSGVIAIAANDLHALALKSDGSVIAWGNPANGRTTVPVAALTGVIAIAAGGNHSLALKSDGTVVAWGQSSEGQTTVPAGLSGVVAIAAGDFNSAAIKSDGSVVAWGYPDFGVNTVPVAALSNALAIAGGGNHAVALVGTRIVDFGSQPIGVAGPWKTFTIKNTGSAALSITSVSVVGFNSGDFAVDTSGMLASIPAAGQTTFRVLFNAGAPGARPIILRVLNNDADESITDITLTGTGSTTLASLQFGVSGAGTNTLTFVGIPGSQYIAQYATNLSTSPWFDFRTNAAGTNGLWQVIAPNATNVQRFYRVRTP